MPEDIDGGLRLAARKRLWCRRLLALTATSRASSWAQSGFAAFCGPPG